MIDINNISTNYGNEDIFKNFSLRLESGELYSLIGPSGCGKSTLIKLLCGIKTDYTGIITFNGKTLNDNPISIGYVPQTYGLLEWKTVKDNIMLPLVLKHTSGCSAYVDEITDILEIANLQARYPHELSGGQKQRVALARAFALKPDLLLMDEPFSALDAFTSTTCQKLFLKIWAEHRVTSLFITHNINEAVSSSKNIIIMNNNNILQIANSSFADERAIAGRATLSAKIMQMFEAGT